MTAENDPLDTIAATVLVPWTADTEMIDRPAERRDYGAGPQSAGRGREEIIRIAVIETDTIAAVERLACTIFIFAYLSCSNGAPYKQGFVLST